MPWKLGTDASLSRGCIVDTNVLFAASFPLDSHNEWAEKVFQALFQFGIPIFTNLNVRSEFIDLNRRVLIPEGLLDFYNDFSGGLDARIEKSLKSLKTRMDKASKENKTFKFSDAEIKEFRSIFDAFVSPSGTNGWDLFCKDYFYHYIKNVWEDTVSLLRKKNILRAILLGSAWLISLVNQGLDHQMR